MPKEKTAKQINDEFRAKEKALAVIYQESSVKRKIEIMEDRLRGYQGTVEHSKNLVILERLKREL